jgi:hypothetical protein
MHGRAGELQHQILDSFIRRPAAHRGAIPGAVKIFGDPFPMPQPNGLPPEVLVRQVCDELRADQTEEFPLL